MHSAATYSYLEAFIFDLDGVIWKGNAPIEGAVESVARLRAAGKRVFYCTNNSRRAPGEFAETLRGLGIECEDEDIMTSSTATSLYLQSLFTGPYTAYVVGEEGLVQAIRRTGAIVMTSPIIPQRSDLHDNHGAVDCVIVGLDATFTYHKLRVASRLVMNGARFIATNRDATFPTPYGIVPGAGTIVSAIETATGVTPITLGKPQPFMAQLLMQKFGLDPKKTCMIGDRLDTDIAAAHRAHISALLVTTGVHSREVAERAKNLQKPDAIYDNLPTLCDDVFGRNDNSPSDISGAAATAVVATGATVIAANAAQYEPEAVLHTPFAAETSSFTGMDAEIADAETADVETAQSAEADASLGAELAPEPVEAAATPEPADAPLPLTASVTSTAPASADFFAFIDEPTSAAAPFAQTAPEAEAAAPADESVDFSFDAALLGDETPAPASAAAPAPAPAPAAAPEPVAAADEFAQQNPAEEPAEEPAPAADDKWWESLDNA